MPYLVVGIFLWLFGLCIGSFLNVVIYRLSAGLSVASPRRSFCPACRATIAWYDNLPILSWVWLRGRCRHCRASISAQYPLVEGLTGLAFVLVYHLLFIGGDRADLGWATLPADLPLLLAWLVLAGCLITCAAMDIASYSVDVRVTYFGLIAGIVLQAAWPRPDFLVPRASSAFSVAAIVMFCIGGLALWWAGRRADEAADQDSPPAPDDHPPPAAGSEPVLARWGGLVVVALWAVVGGWLLAAGNIASTAAVPIRAVLVAIGLASVFLVTVIAGGVRRASDEEIRAAIEEERPTARKTAVSEFVWLLPAVVAGAAAILAMPRLPVLAAGWSHLVSWSPGANLYPVAGVAVAVKGAAIAAGVGWLLRIVFTLIYGREAFGLGDIHILAAAGALAGWDIAVLGLLLSVGIALVGWMLGLLLKTTALIPFGPWLAHGIVLALWWSRPAHQLADTYSAGIVQAWRDRPDLLMAAGGVMLVGSAAAIAFSRLVRRWLCPDDQ